MVGRSAVIHDYYIGGRGDGVKCLNPFSFIFVSSEEIGTVDPQGPWEYLDHWFFHVQGVAGECTARDRSEPLDLS